MTHRTTFLATVGVRFSADGYEDAGRILDAIDLAVAGALKGRGGHELTGFQAMPRPAAGDYGDRYGAWTTPTP
jgi:hypothetical protein